VLLVPNADNPAAVEAAVLLASWIEGEAGVPLLVGADASACDLERLAAPAAAFGALDLVVALGGDGTILKAVHLLAGVKAPILGVNLGRLGFLAGAHGADLPGAVAAALAGSGRIETRCTLEVRVSAGGRDAGTHHALNEVFVGRRPGGRAVDIDLAIDGVSLLRCVCDGIIVATPTGSTAYSLSVGGPVLSPDVRGLLVVPVGPHTLCSRPVVIGPSERVSLTFPDLARSDTCVSVDGDGMPSRSALDRVEVGMGPHDVSLVRLDDRRFYPALRDTFFGG
jgi:NAD+ kinase